MGIWYATRESVKAALDSAVTARNDGQVDRAIDAASRSVETLCHRKNGFYPTIATRYFDWPDPRRSRPWRLWLDGDTVISVTTLTAGGVAIAAADYFLEPANDGPPFDLVEVDLASSAAFSAGATHQRAIAISGTFGYRDDSVPAGALAEGLDSSETAVDVTDAAAVGVGDVLRVDDERMVVTGRGMLDTGQNASALTASNADVSITGVTAGSVAAGEVILVDSERMLVVDVAGTTLTVKRAWDGSVLAAHLVNADIYAARTLTVTRGALGTTAAAHSTAAPVTRYDPPALVRDLTIAEALNTLQQQASGYARTVRAGEGQTDAPGGDLPDLRRRVRRAHGRLARTGAV